MRKINALIERLDDPGKADPKDVFAEISRIKKESELSLRRAEKDLINLQSITKLKHSKPEPRKPVKLSSNDKVGLPNIKDEIEKIRRADSMKQDEQLANLGSHRSRADDSFNQRSAQSPGSPHLSQGRKPPSEKWPVLNAGKLGEQKVAQAKAIFKESEELSRHTNDLKLNSLMNVDGSMSSPGSGPPQQSASDRQHSSSTHRAVAAIRVDISVTSDCGQRVPNCRLALQTQR